ncbi:hypothetical protein LCGC14_2703960 [marine sediment metagenome]|uniref:Uncharacterized protein n=1 Tax=marine sediment metagenome TaxID=412755 RepID=A0A0F9BP33_9ZZZZ
MGVQIEIGGITNLLVRRVVREASKKTLDGAVVVRFIAQADKEILAKIREVVEGQLLTDDEIDKEHNRWCMRGRIDKDELKISWRQWIAKAQLQAILKAMED